MKFAIRIEKEGEKRTIPLVGTVRAGRVSLHNDEENLLVDSHDTVSRRHALFINKHDSVFLFDCGSVNQTFLNGEVVEPNKEIKLKVGDKIRLADSTSIMTIEKAKDQSKEKEERQDHSRSRSREKERQKKKATVSASTLKMLKGIDKYKSRQDKIKFLKLMGHKNAEEELDLIEAEKTTGKVSFDRANQQIEKQFERGRMSVVKKGLGN